MSECFLQPEQGDAAFAKLMAAPVSAPRKRVRRAKVELEESTPTAGKSLADIIRGCRKPYQSPLSKPMPTYRHWLAKFLSPEDADREDARAKAEWQAIRSHPFIAAVLGGQWQASPRVTARIMARIARVRAAAVEQQPAHPGPLRELVRLPRAAKSRNSWPSYREQQIASLIAARDWEYLADIGYVDVIELAPMPAEQIETPEYAEAA